MIPIRKSTLDDGPRVLEIWRDAVDATHDFLTSEDRGTGAGKTRLQHALALPPVITTDVNEQNAQAVGFCERMGFTPTGRSALDRQGRPYPLIHLRSTNERRA